MVSIAASSLTAAAALHPSVATALCATVRSLLRTVRSSISLQRVCAPAAAGAAVSASENYPAAAAVAAALQGCDVSETLMPPLAR